MKVHRALGSGFLEPACR
ncbi:MAG TPA: hypothetical protein VFM82_06430 [Flavobacteriaceae bacterium]|nr:hypothetical protein [Flavobacteriaceae bacterium]